MQYRDLGVHQVSDLYSVYAGRHDNSTNQLSKIFVCRSLLIHAHTAVESGLFS